MNKTIFVMGVLLLVTVLAFGQTTISIADYGLLPDTRENATPYVKKALESVNDSHITLCFPKGRYDFWPHHCIERDYFESNTTDINPKRLAILIEDKNHFTLDGGGSVFIMHDRIQPITIEHSENISIQNLSIDWEIPLTAEVQVIKVLTDGFEIRIDPFQFPYIIENEKLVFVGEGWKSTFYSIMEFDHDTKLVVPGTGDKGVLGGSWQKYVAEEIEKGVVRITKPGGFERLPNKGNYLVLRHSKRDHAGVFCFHSKNLLIQDVSIHHTAGLGILAQYTENIHFNRVKMVPNDHRNVLSGHDDGFHIMGCKGEILVEHCEFAGLMDDPMNVHGTCARIVEVISPTRVRCKLMHHQSQGLKWGQKGDRIGLIENRSMRTAGEAIIVDYTYLTKDLFEVEVDRKIPDVIDAGAAIENLTWTPDLTVRNTHFRSCRARGILISTPGKVWIENNIFESSGSAILVAGDANYWYESGGVRDITIRYNEFRYPCMSSAYQFCESIISIFPEIPEVDAKHPFHQNITIENNRFEPFDYPILFAKSVSNLKFRNNTITRSHRFEPFHHRKAGLTFIACKGVEVTNNTIVGEVLGKTVDLIGMKKGELSLNDSFFEVTE